MRRRKGEPDHCLGRSRGGLATKIHVVVDAQGLPIRFGLTAGQTHDGQVADRPLDHLGPRTIVQPAGRAGVALRVIIAAVSSGMCLRSIAVLAGQAGSAASAAAMAGEPVQAASISHR